MIEYYCFNIQFRASKNDWTTLHVSFFNDAFGPSSRDDRSMVGNFIV
ncbi:hypothetical protein LINPERPRIM_LOCUS21361, partial [Linum perenne]